MSRHNKYAIYKGKEYRIIKMGGHLKLISKDKQDVENGFLPFKLNSDLYYKKVKTTDLETAYDVVPFAQYKGIEFQIIRVNEEEGTVLLYSIDSKIGREFGMHSHVGEKFEKYVRTEEVTLIEKKKKISGFI
ncbi:hypothetical protein WAX78_15685 [Bacillus sp. FJAT-53711]|uniref:DUF1653 domain-containing protein n=1 Tax=Bacillus yunxiaonensis TaxID=3127665 RepID=A0ABU8G102_9BACI